MTIKSSILSDSEESRLIFRNFRVGVEDFQPLQDKSLGFRLLKPNLNLIMCTYLQAMYWCCGIKTYTHYRKNKTNGTFGVKQNHYRLNKINYVEKRIRMRRDMLQKRVTQKCDLYQSCKQLKKK